MREVIGIVRLAPGEVGYYDELTRMHLTIANPQHPVYAGMNTTNIKRSVRSGRLILVSGTLSATKNDQSVKDVKRESANNIKSPPTSSTSFENEKQKKEESIAQSFFCSSSEFEVNIATQKIQKEVYELIVDQPPVQNEMQGTKEDDLQQPQLSFQGSGEIEIKEPEKEQVGTKKSSKKGGGRKKKKSNE